MLTHIHNLYSHFVELLFKWKSTLSITVYDYEIQGLLIKVYYPQCQLLTQYQIYWLTPGETIHIWKPSVTIMTMADIGE